MADLPFGVGGGLVCRVIFAGVGLVELVPECADGVA